MRFLLPCLLAGAIAGNVTAQYNEVGLTMDGGVLTVIYGQVCGPVTCQPFPGGTVGPGQTRLLVHYSNPTSLYIIAIGLQGPCLPVPGFGNVLLLDSPVILSFGVTSTPPFVPTGCNQGMDSYTLSIPPSAPLGFQFRVQSLGFSNFGVLAFGPAIEATIQ
ncbi:MAG TPA: hypothetical protein VFD82_08005 [Planctomycetota bacterium]|nr:hypothetical protein [Planctomycetota bacterium]